jgi:hypothetical protein
MFNFIFSKWHILTNFLCKGYQNIVKKNHDLKDFFKDFLKNILRIFLQKQSKSKKVRFMLSCLHPWNLTLSYLWITIKCVWPFTHFNSNYYLHKYLVLGWIKRVFMIGYSGNSVVVHPQLNHKRFPMDDALVGVDQDTYFG